MVVSVKKCAWANVEGSRSKGSALASKMLVLADAQGRSVYLKQLLQGQVLKLERQQSRRRSKPFFEFEQAKMQAVHSQVHQRQLVKSPTDMNCASIYAAT